MLLLQILLAILGLSVPVLALMVGGRLGLCTSHAIRARRFRVAMLSIAGIAGLVALLAAVVAAWFAYGIAHTGKTPWTDLRVAAVTILPFHGACLALWRMAGNLRRRLTNRGG